LSVFIQICYDDEKYKYNDNDKDDDKGNPKDGRDEQAGPADSDFYSFFLYFHL